jgi:hypothetical protein
VQQQQQRAEQQAFTPPAIPPGHGMQLTEPACASCTGSLLPRQLMFDDASFSCLQQQQQQQQLVQSYNPRLTPVGNLDDAIHTALLSPTQIQLPPLSAAAAAGGVPGYSGPRSSSSNSDGTSSRSAAHNAASAAQQAASAAQAEADDHVAAAAAAEAELAKFRQMHSSVINCLVCESSPRRYVALRTHGRKKSRPSRTRGQWGEPYGVTVHKKRGVLIIHSFIHVATAQAVTVGCHCFSQFRQCRAHSDDDGCVVSSQLWVWCIWLGLLCSAAAWCCFPARTWLSFRSA